MVEIALIKLTQGKVAIIDADDFNEVNKFKWFYDGIGYANRTSRIKGKTISVRMHRFIMKLRMGDVKEIDHINGNKLDNRKSNLRICKHWQNCLNKSIRTNNTSGFMGVNWFKRTKKWRTQIQYRGKRICKYFDKKIDAINTYKELSEDLFKEYSPLKRKK